LLSAASVGIFVAFAINTFEAKKGPGLFGCCCKKQEKRGNLLGNLDKEKKDYKTFS